MTLSAYASPAPPRAAAVLSHPMTASLLIVVAALAWASVGFASSLFTNDIVVNEETSSLVRMSVIGPLALVLLCIGAWIGGLWRLRSHG
jgi:hypothetical protein